MASKKTINKPIEKDDNMVSVFSYMYGNYHTRRTVSIDLLVLSDEELELWNTSFIPTLYFSPNVIIESTEKLNDIKNYNEELKNANYYDSEPPRPIHLDKTYNEFNILIACYEDNLNYSSDNTAYKDLFKKEAISLPHAFLATDIVDWIVEVYTNFPEGFIVNIFECDHFSKYLEVQ